MPLKCLHHQNPIFAFDYDEAGWDQLKASHRAEPCLTMACCGAKAILKVSKLGTRFFAHHAIVYCSSATETEEHLLAKTLVCQAARAAGWSADTDVKLVSTQAASVAGAEVLVDGATVYAKRDATLSGGDVVLTGGRLGSGAALSLSGATLTDSGGLRVLVDLTKQVSSEAIKVLEEVLAELKRRAN